MGKRLLGAGASGSARAAVAQNSVPSMSAESMVSSGLATIPARSLRASFSRAELSSRSRGSSAKPITHAPALRQSRVTVSRSGTPSSSSCMPESLRRIFPSSTERGRKSATAAAITTRSAAGSSARISRSRSLEEQSARASAWALPPVDRQQSAAATQLEVVRARGRGQEPHRNPLKAAHLPRPPPCAPMSDCR